MGAAAASLQRAEGELGPPVGEGALEGLRRAGERVTTRAAPVHATHAEVYMLGRASLCSPSASFSIEAVFTDETSARSSAGLGGRRVSGDVRTAH